MLSFSVKILHILSCYGMLRKSRAIQTPPEKQSRNNCGAIQIYTHTRCQKEELAILSHITEIRHLRIFPPQKKIMKVDHLTCPMCAVFVNLLSQLKVWSTSVYTPHTTPHHAERTLDCTHTKKKKKKKRNREAQKEKRKSH